MNREVRGTTITRRVHALIINLVIVLTVGFSLALSAAFAIRSEAFFTFAWNAGFVNVLLTSDRSIRTALTLTVAAVPLGWMWGVVILTHNHYRPIRAFRGARRNFDRDDGTIEVRRRNAEIAAQRAFVLIFADMSNKHAGALR